MLLHIVARGRIGRSAEAELVDRYLKRIAWGTRVTELPDVGGRVPEPLPQSRTVLLDERGEILFSTDFSGRLGRWADDGVREARFLIGAATGSGTRSAALRTCCSRWGARPGRICWRARCWPSSCTARRRSSPATRTTARDDAARAPNLAAARRIGGGLGPGQSGRSVGGSAGDWRSQGRVGRGAGARGGAGPRRRRRARRGRARADRGAGGRRGSGGAEADLAAAEARVRIVDALLAGRRRDLAARQAPVARLLGALGIMARAPTVATVARPGSLDDLVHLRAVLGSVTPVVRTQTVALRRELAETRRLRDDAGVAAEALAESRAALVRERRAFAVAGRVAYRTGRHAAAARVGPVRSGDRAGETARDLVDRMDQASDAARTARDLAALPGPPAAVAPPFSGKQPYRLPVAGRLITGFGEVSADGVRARGLTFAVRARRGGAHAGGGAGGLRAGVSAATAWSR